MWCPVSVQVTNYQCPACTAPLQFGAGTGKLQCEYCMSSFTVEEIELAYGEANAEAAEAKPNAHGQTMYDELWGEDAERMRFYSCPACGAELICDETTAATSCPYCSNPTIVPGQFTGVRRPDYVIPFKLTKTDAVEALKNHCKGKVLLPKAFRTEHHVQEIKGVYVPFWLFDGEAECHANYNASNSRVYTSGDYRVTETDHFHVHRAGNFRFERVPVDGSSKMPDNHMDSIEPYDYAELKPFSTAYLPGYLADKYDVSAEESAKRVNERIRGSASELLRETVQHYQSVLERNADVNVKRGDIKYALLPVWMLHTKWKEKDYLFAMNGQTGKLIGDLPVDKGKFAAWMAGISLPLMAILLLLLF